MADLYEIHPRKLEAIGNNYWRGERTFLVPRSQSASIIRNQRGKVHPDAAGVDYAPVCRGGRAVSLTDRAGYSVLTLLYESPRFAAIPGKPGRARLIMKVGSEAVRITHDKAGKPLVGQIPGDPPGNIWQLVNASPYRLEPVVSLRILTAHYLEDWRGGALVSNLIGCVNAAPTGNILGAAAGTLRLLGVDTDWQFGDRLLYADYLLAWRAQGWGVKTQRCAQIPTAQYVAKYVDSKKMPAIEDVATGITRVPGYKVDAGGDVSRIEKDSGVESRVLDIEPADFNLLNGLVAWK